MDLFSVLDLPRSLRLDPDLVRERYFAQSRLYHPDFHGSTDSGTLQGSIEMSSLLNQAYRTLIDPFERARYLLSLELPDPDGHDRKRIPASLLMEVMEMQETVAALHAESDQTRRVPMIATLQSVRNDLQGKMDALRGDLDALAERWDALPQDTDPDKKNTVLSSLNLLLNTRSYLRTLLASIENELSGNPDTPIRH